MTRVGVIVRADLTGLGVQSRNWVRLLKPHKVIMIDSRPFNNNEQHHEWYKEYDPLLIYGFIQNWQIDIILKDIDVLLTFEIPYNYELIKVAKQRGIKTIIQNNWEFTDYLQNPNLPFPDLLVNHSYWHLNDQKALWPEITEYCATPVFLGDYDSIYQQNLERTGKKRFLHVAGRKTHEDRNGTQDLLEAVKLIPKDVDFELVIKAQTAEFDNIDDPRVTIDRNSPVDEKELYRDFDAVIMPRRYGGACLPMTEALSAGLPVIMNIIEPNSRVLPPYWLVPSEKKTAFMARTMIEVWSAIPKELAETIIGLAELSDDWMVGYKKEARMIAVREYSSESVSTKWALLLGKLGL